MAECVGYACASFGEDGHAQGVCEFEDEGPLAVWEGITNCPHPDDWEPVTYYADAGDCHA